jgi:1,2-phenylacetyl-CoA epoxidase catalytic subunit
MEAGAFLAELDRDNARALERIAASAAREPSGEVTVPKLLLLALKNELEATECAAHFIVSTPEVEVKLALARQAGDEAKHYRMIADRLRELGFDARGFDPIAQGFGPLFQYLDSLPTTVERVAAGQFTREAIAVVKNRQFIEFCDRAGDRVTATLYRDIIEPDERFHHELGRSLLLKLATTPDAQEAARRAAARTLALAEELQGAALRTAGIHHAPGC